jgi:hypothetical protein
MQTAPAIEKSLAESKKTEAFIASLLLTSADAVSADYEKLLKGIPVGDKVPPAGALPVAVELPFRGGTRAKAVIIRRAQTHQPDDIADTSPTD